MGAVLVAAGGVALFGVLIEKLLAFQVVYTYTAWSLAGAGACAALGLWWWKRPKPMEVAILVDERLGLKERFSSTLAFTHSDDPPYPA